MSNGYGELDKEGCEYGRHTKKKIENLEKSFNENCALMRNDMKEISKKLDQQKDLYYELKSQHDQNSWVAPIITAIITGGIVVFLGRLFL